MASFNPNTGKWTDSSGGQHDSESQARKHDGKSFGEEAAGGGAMLLVFLIACFAVIILVADNLWYAVILAAAFFAGWLIRRYATKGVTNATARFGIKILSWLVFLGGAYGCYYDKTLGIDPAICAVATINKDAEIRGVIPFIKRVKGTVKEGDRITVLGITRNRKLLKVQTTTEDGKLIKGLMHQSAAKDAIVTYHRPFFTRVWNFEISNKPLFLFVGTYVSDRKDGYELHIWKPNKNKMDLRENKKGVINHICTLHEEVTKAKPVAEIDGVPYYYQMTLSATPPEWYIENGMTPPPPVVYESFQGDYIITSNTSFVGNGRTWTLKRN